MLTWTREDDNRAHNDGWHMNTSSVIAGKLYFSTASNVMVTPIDNIAQIVRWPSMGVVIRDLRKKPRKNFTSNQEASDYVWKRAGSGDKFYQKAVAFLVQSEMERERTRIDFGDM